MSFWSTVQPSPTFTSEDDEPGPSRTTTRVQRTRPFSADSYASQSTVFNTPHPSTQSQPAPLAPAIANTSMDIVHPQTNTLPASTSGVEWRVLSSLKDHSAISFSQLALEIEHVAYIRLLITNLREVFTAVEHMRVNKEQWKLLQGRCVMIVRLVGVQVSTYQEGHYPWIENAMLMLRETLDKIARQAQHHSAMDHMLACMQFQSISGEIKTLFEELDLCLGLFSYTTNVAQSQWVSELHGVQEQELAELPQLLNQLIGDSAGIDQASGGPRRGGGLMQDLFGSPAVPLNTGGVGSAIRESRSGTMSTLDTFETLKAHGCYDLTGVVDLSSISSYPVATGGRADVWKGKLHDDTTVAIKVWRFSPEATVGNPSSKGAMRELYNWSKADHENVHKLLGVVVFQGRVGMVSEWMENGDLQDYIRRHETVDRYQLCLQVAKSVQYLHSNNIVHGDLKARNFLVSSGGLVKLTDFDNSIISSYSPGFLEGGKSGGGTLRWMAPELVLSDVPNHRNKQTDIYALGMTCLC